MTSKGHIYLIWTPLDNSFCYIGSTFNRLHKRFEEHKSRYKKYLEDNTQKKCSIIPYFEKYDVKNFKIDLIKSYKVIREHKMDFKHLSAYETLWINKTKNCINKILPFSPMKYFNIKNSQKKYQEQNKDKIKERNKNYREENKDKYKDYQKNYQEQNKDKIKKDKNTKIECECGGKYTKTHKAQHFKSKKHINYIANLDNSI